LVCILKTKSVISQALLSTARPQCVFAIDKRVPFYFGGAPAEPLWTGRLGSAGALPRDAQFLMMLRINGGTLLRRLQGLARRKNCCAPEMIFVTTYCPLTTTGVLETLAQTIGAERFVVDCNVKPELLVGHPITSELAVVPDPEVMAVATSTGGELDTTGEAATNVGENTAVLSPAVSWLKSIPST
jgi:hypothetical protein